MGTTVSVGQHVGAFFILLPMVCRKAQGDVNTKRGTAIAQDICWRFDRRYCDFLCCYLYQIL